MPVLGRPGPGGAGAATVKHSEVALVCAAAVKTPVLATSGAYSVRQQYLPGELVAVVGLDVARPATNGLVDPTWVPPLVQPDDFVWPGAHKKNLTVPVGTGPAPPLPMFTESVAEVPGVIVTCRGALVLVITGSRHERKLSGPAKSLSPEVND